MATPTLPVMLRSLSYQQSNFNRVAQTYQTIGKLSSTVESFDLVPQVTQFADRSRESFAAAHQADVVPHDVLNRLHIALDQCRVGLGGQSAFIPRRDGSEIWSLRSRGPVDGFFDALRGAGPPHYPSSREVEARRFAPWTPVQL